ncbi:hypothetical protein MUK42_21515 [Musa troglodytarum]|uniref:Uncharacterized protein n=1 Tax=Musa troglodytarum TaxID=320322 RepID=A0A9E7GHK8_9LILI|nr:hypothetical protein MUK42_21515 [Musa troglodytarum]
MVRSRLIRSLRPGSDSNGPSMGDPPLGEPIRCRRHMAQDMLLYVQQRKATRGSSVVEMIILPFAITLIAENWDAKSPGGERVDPTHPAIEGDAVRTITARRLRLRLRLILLRRLPLNLRPALSLLSLAL